MNPTTEIMIVHITNQKLNANDGKFVSPPVYDFYSVIASFINDNSPVLIHQLTATRMPIFQTFQRISNSSYNPTSLNTIPPEVQEVIDEAVSFLKITTGCGCSGINFITYTY